MEATSSGHENRGASERGPSTTAATIWAACSGSRPGSLRMLGVGALIRVRMSGMCIDVTRMFLVRSSGATLRNHVEGAPAQ
ncbi:hypothetical protein [Gordonia sp. OPL2]|uniref:hypothetical protein n=1 Tax=Gordonia sp. OPL2 TaxID=2486274 RepID=UPI001656236E|nr:hypothetical protein [Gordonia sp. OPL2]ROZ99310.1 hypothetical protein EEB19_11405 [Gordonia sp. OPL2]